MGVGSRVRRAARAIAPYTIAVFFGLVSLRSVNCGNIVYSDAARHAMNGALLHDLVASGNIARPIEFTYEHYSRLPATSLPFHPPLFPAIESLWFGVFGVNVVAARVLISLFTGVSAFLLYRLVLATHESHGLALACTLTVFTIPIFHQMSTDVMLEIPTLLFVVAAVYLIRDLDREYSLKRGIAFALIGGAAMWTKQNGVFVGLIPFLMIACTRRWSLLRRIPIWASSAALGFCLLALMRYNRMAMPYGLMGHFAAYGSLTGEWGLTGVVATNLYEYASFIVTSFTLPFSIVLALSGTWYLIDVLRGNCDRRIVPYLSWALAATVLPILTFGYDPRYLFFAMPAYAMIALSALQRLGTVLLSEKRGSIVAFGVACILIARGIDQPASQLAGPNEVAAFINENDVSRVLYCGATDGQFIFAIRSLHAQYSATPVIIRGDKLDPKVFSTNSFVGYLHRNRINYIVLEEWQTDETTDSWTTLLESPPTGLVKIKAVRISRYPNTPRTGRLVLFRLVAASPPSTQVRSSRMPRTTNARSAGESEAQVESLDELHAKRAVRSKPR